MKSLFVRTFFWLLATVVLTFIAMTVAAALDFDPDERRRGPLGSLVSLQLAEARHAWETGGAEGLGQALQRFKSATGFDGVLTDRSGRDLLTGEHRRDLLQAMRARRRASYWRRERTIVARRSPDGQYLFFTVLQRRNVLGWILQPEIHLTVLGVLAVISFAFARRLTNPVKTLRDVVERFGKGDLRARSGSRRQDEIGDLARAFDRMASRTETLLAAERRLLLDISHELRSPLARLGVALELARSEPGETRHLDRIEREAHRLNTLVGELLQVTRAEGDAARMRKEDLALEELIDSIVEDVSVEAQARGCALRWTERRPVQVRADAELLRRAIENVIRNATRFAPEGSDVDVSLRCSASEANVEVRDRGPGVPAEHLPRIFDAFYRVDTDRNRASGGTVL
ncbi:MAG TPA: ATP-binding protein [Bryobacteraceae bacterium]|nr:ATP-binding protein [Bryobacteraceae bacterium]